MKITIPPKHRSFEPRLLLRTAWERVRTDSLVRNSGFMMATTAVTSVLGYIYWIIAAHLYAPAQIGLASTLIGAMTIASNVSNTGICSSLVHRLPQQTGEIPWSLTVNAAVIAGVTTGVIAGIAESLIVPDLSSQLAGWSQPGLRAVIILSVPLWNLSLLVDYIFVAERASGRMLVRNTTFVVLKIPLLVLPLVLAHSDAAGIFWSWMLATGVSVFAAIFLLIPRLGRTYRLIVRGMTSHIRGLLSSLAGHHLVNVAEMAPAYLLTVLVTARLSTTSAAYFYTTWMVGNIFFLVSPAVTVSLFAEGSHAAHDIMSKARKSAILMGLLLGPAIIVAFLGGRIILSMFGSAYAQHGLLLLWVTALSAIPDSIVNIYISVLRVQEHMRRAIALSIGMAALAVALTWVLLPMIGIVGVGVAWLTAKSVGCLVAFADILGASTRKWLKKMSTRSMP